MLLLTFAIRWERKDQSLAEERHSVRSSDMRQAMRRINDTTEHSLILRERGENEEKEVYAAAPAPERRFRLVTRSSAIRPFRRAVN